MTENVQLIQKASVRYGVKIHITFLIFDLGK